MWKLNTSEPWNLLRGVFHPLASLDVLETKQKLCEINFCLETAPKSNFKWFRIEALIYGEKTPKKASRFGLRKVKTLGIKAEVLIWVRPFTNHFNELPQQSFKISISIGTFWGGLRRLNVIPPVHGRLICVCQEPSADKINWHQLNGNAPRVTWDWKHIN